jgi:hypothetical protein
MGFSTSIVTNLYLQMMSNADPVTDLMSLDISSLGTEAEQLSAAL